jgi:hypothetical protein
LGRKRPCLRLFPSLPNNTPPLEHLDPCDE